jgi:ribose-phosphate pyrophosphokinase
MDAARKVVFSTESYRYMLAPLAAGVRADAGEIVHKTFPDGERYLRLQTDVEQADVVLIGGTISDADTLELFDLAGSIVKYGARSLCIVIPYFGYATMERAVKVGEVVTAKSRARLLSAIPNGDAPNHVLLFDVHTEGLPYYFEGATVPMHVYGKPLITQLVQRVAARDGLAIPSSDLVLACTDAGRAKWVESLANDMGVAASFVFKRRISGDETVVTAVSAQVEGKTVVIYDDMIRTGGSLLSAARAYRAAGALRIAAVATHGLFPGDSLKKLEDSGEFERIACTDSHPRARALESSFLEVASCTDLFAQRLQQTDAFRLANAQ